MYKSNKTFYSRYVHENLRSCWFGNPIGSGSGWIYFFSGFYRRGGYWRNEYRKVEVKGLHCMVIARRNKKELIEFGCIVWFVLAWVSKKPMSNDASWGASRWNPVQAVIQKYQQSFCRRFSPEQLHNWWTWLQVACKEYALGANIGKSNNISS